MSIYMKIDGIDGDVTAKGHEKWIEIDSVSFECERHVYTQPGRATNRDGTRPQIGQFVVSKTMDRSSPILFSESVTGIAKKKIIITLNTTGKSLSTYMEYTLSNVLVCRYRISSQCTRHNDSNHEKQNTYPHEKINFNFDKIEMKFTPYGDNHQPESPVPAGYDLKEAVQS